VTAVDSSGHGRNGTYSGGVGKGMTGALANDPNKAARFDGSTGTVSVPDDAALRFNGSWSIEFWARQITYPTLFAGIVYKGASGSPNGYSVYADPQGGLWFKRNNKQFSSGTGSLTSTYRYFVATYDGTKLRWYVDGALTTTSSVNFGNNTGSQPLELGRGDQYGNNDLDEVAIYGSALSGARIAAHYAAGN
jgi:concanavalin A-like lectin/glucanase superfamily protein